ncbi:MAG TPA: exodeoxyribonuclease VII large subunit [Erysipelotrichaceae bacterium]|nr:exodeoxyribonuclease VII large subunit [Erysipelotrichaceae bacterium]
MSSQVISVSRLVHYLKNRLESDSLIRGVLVEGELSNFSSYRSGHWYFSLKDENALIRCAMFASRNRAVSFVPKDGDKVIVQGDISVYEQRGDMQLIVSSMRSSTIGELYLQYELLKKKLAEEGLFDDAHKKELPRFPMKIALVTGANTAARSDVLTTLQRRWPVAEIQEYPVLVQGKESAGQIIDALKAVDTTDADVCLLVRGGGSIEDLWSFNDEQLARTIYAMRIPVVTGVGHEINFTIADYVSDVRAPTPTGAAELCSPSIADVADQIAAYRRRLYRLTDARIAEERSYLETVRNKSFFRMPERLYANQSIHLSRLSSDFIRLMNARVYGIRKHIDDASVVLADEMRRILKDTEMRLVTDKSSVVSAMDSILQKEKAAYSSKAGLLDAYSPLKVLSRGYAVVSKDHTAVRSAAQLAVNDTVDVRLGTGNFKAGVISINQEDSEYGEEGTDI